MTMLRMRKLIEKQTNYKFDSTGGTVAFTPPAGYDAPSLEVFTWINKKKAPEMGIPSGYFVFIIAGIRIRLPFIEWNQTERRPWSDIGNEFLRVIKPILQAPANQAVTMISELPERYIVSLEDGSGAGTLVQAYPNW